MPYNLKHVYGAGGKATGAKVTSPNHPQGFSKGKMTLRNAKAQLRLLNAIEHDPNFKRREK